MKVQSPKTGRFITLGGPTYNKLLKDGYYNPFFNNDILYHIYSFIPIHKLPNMIINKYTNELCQSKYFWVDKLGCIDVVHTSVKEWINQYHYQKNENMIKETSDSCFVNFYIHKSYSKYDEELIKNLIHKLQYKDIENVSNISMICIQITNYNYNNATTVEVILNKTPVKYTSDFMSKNDISLLILNHYKDYNIITNGNFITIVPHIN